MKKGMKPRRAPRIMKIQVDLPPEINYKDVATMRKLVSDRGKVLSRRYTGIVAKKQRLLNEAIKRLRFLGLLPVGSAKRK
ncbi:MAG: 30S ribosomal protein S18 [Candidatus Omnitrophica bacterium]|nr:30S ribosomal protein S18 [Candidatus Omnitrophota bacterium]